MFMVFFSLTSRALLDHLKKMTETSAGTSESKVY